VATIQTKIIKKGKQPETMPLSSYVSNKKNISVIGVPKEIDKDEKRVAITPDDVAIITDLGFDVLVERNAGLDAGIYDLAYSEAGAKIVDSHHIIYKNADIIAKIAPLNDLEIVSLRENKIIFSALNLSTQKRKNIELLQEKKTTALAFEFFNDVSGFNPFLHVIGEIIGTSAVMIAAELLSTTGGGSGIMLGGLSGLPPAEIIILGTDIAAEYAVKLALGLGADVKVFDNSMQNLIHFHKTFGQQLYTSTLNYSNLRKSLQTADVVINTLSKTPEKKIIVSQEMVSLMKKGAVIIDLKVDAGSIIETSKITTFENPTFKVNDIIHYCVPNLASRVALTSSVAISNLLSVSLIKILQQGSIIPFLQYDTNIRNGTFMFKGALTNKIVAETLGLKYTDINFIVHVF
jgi:alanine dehydrogenase